MRASKNTAVAAGPRHRGDEIHLLRELVRTHQVLMAGFSRRMGLPASQFTLMRVLINAGGPVGVMDLSRQIGINAAAITRQVKEMEAGGLLSRQSDPKDGRRCSLSLTPKGAELFREMHDRSHELERALSSVVSRDEMSAAAVVLAKVRGVLETALNGDAP